MRMWMVVPSKMCRKHLLGEHVELHMLMGALAKGKSIAGFLERGLLEPQNARVRHAELVAEMERRGYVHGSELVVTDDLPVGRVDRAKSWGELSNRCQQCRERGVTNESRLA